MSRSRGPVALAIVSATALLVLTVLVAIGATQRIDVAARDYFRPGDEWGSLQMRVDVLVEGLKPRNVAPLMALVGIAASLLQKSWRPAVYVAAIACVAGALTLLTKLVTERSDPHYEMTAIGGSFPSGHTMGVLVLLGAAVLVFSERSRWWEWVVVVVAGLGMGFALLVQAAHWLTDVVGGVLLAVTVLSLASVSLLRSSRTEAVTSESRGSASLSRDDPVGGRSRGAR